MRKFNPKVNSKVHIQVHKNFFDNVFEPKRRQLQKQLGLSNLTQSQFTAMIKDLNLNIKINKPRQDKKFAPKKINRFKFNI